jgi:hypothetical protein
MLAPFWVPSFMKLSAGLRLFEGDRSALIIEKILNSSPCLTPNAIVSDKLRRFARIVARLDRSRS